jgi:hypothetical protein
MDAYIFQADIYCEPCARELMGFYSARRGQEDSDDYPQGPYSDGGGEADCPNHCGSCGTFLENPLTGEGYDYVQECRNGPTGDSETVKEWLDFYGMDEDA